jgi:hypothetical protein
VSVFGPDLSAASDAAAASWIAARLGEFGTVGGLVPDGFEGCLLVRPKPLPDGTVDDIVLLGAIAGVARRHTATPDRVWFAIWDGYGWDTASTRYTAGAGGRSRPFARLSAQLPACAADRRRHDEVRAGLDRVPAFDLPHRRYYLVVGSALDAARVCEPGTGRRQVPDLWWPEDRAWFVATDTDLDWTYVGGSEEFIADVAAAFPDSATP